MWYVILCCNTNARKILKYQMEITDMCWKRRKKNGLTYVCHGLFAQKFKKKKVNIVCPIPNKPKNIIFVSHFILVSCVGVIEWILLDLLSYPSCPSLSSLPLFPFRPLWFVLVSRFLSCPLCALPCPVLSSRIYLNHRRCFFSCLSDSLHPKTLISSSFLSCFSLIVIFLHLFLHTSGKGGST